MSGSLSTHCGTSAIRRISKLAPELVLRQAELLAGECEGRHRELTLAISTSHSQRVSIHTFHRNYLEDQVLCEACGVEQSWLVYLDISWIQDRQHSQFSA